MQQWGLGDRILRDRLAGTDEQTCRNVEWRRGMLPPGPLGGRQLDQVLAEVGPLVDAAAPLLAAGRRTVDVLVDLPGGRLLRGSVPGLHGDRLVTVTYSKLGARDRLRAWIALVALTAATSGNPVDGGHRRPRRSWPAADLGARSGRRGARRPGARSELVELYDEGLRAPLPSRRSRPLPRTPPPGAADNESPDAIRRARMRWASGDFPGEDADAANERVWGRRAAVRRADRRHRPPERSGPAANRRRFGELALRLWGPLLDAERMGRP